MSIKEILKTIRHIEVYAEKAVEEQLLGRYKSSFQGQGMEFAEVREYVWGDDIRHIDWNVTSRTGKTYLKTYVEDRHLSIIIAIDTAESMDFSSQILTKKEMALRITAMITLSASKDQNKVGLALHNQFQLQQFIQPQMGEAHALALLHKLILSTTKQSLQDNKKKEKHLVNALLSYLRKRTTLFLISDFWLTENDYESLKKLSQAHHLFPIIIEDPLEKELITNRNLTLRNIKTGQIYYLSTSELKELKKHYEEERKRFYKFCLKHKIEYLSLNTKDDYAKKLFMFFSHLRKKS